MCRKLRSGVIEDIVCPSFSELSARSDSVRPPAAEVPRITYIAVATAASASRRTGATLQMSPNILCVRIFVCSQHPSPARASRAGSDIQIVTPPFKLPVAFVGVRGGSGSGAFIASSSSLQGIAKTQITQLKCGTGKRCDLQVSRYRPAGRLTESVRSPSNTGLRVSN